MTSFGEKKLSLANLVYRRAKSYTQRAFNDTKLKIKQIIIIFAHVDT